MKRGVALLVFVTACAAPIPRPTTADALRASATRPTTLAELERGREVYVRRCGNCHQPVQPSEYAPAAWPKHVDDMAERAKLATDDRELIVRFLVTLAAR